MEAGSSDFDSAWRIASGIDGWLTRSQAGALAKAAADVPPGSSIVEIGSHQGRSTVMLGTAKPEVVRLVAVDPFEDPRWGGGQESYAVLRENLARAGIDDGVQIFRGTSEQAAGAWDGSLVGLLFVDGAHDHPTVLTDLDRWEPFVADGGRVYVHDAFSSPGVTFALLQRHLLNRSFRYLGSVRSLAMFRHERQSVPTAAISAARLLLRLPYFGRNVAVKLCMRRGWQTPQRLLGHTEPGYPY